MFAVIDQFGPVIYPSRWIASLLNDNFADGIAMLFTAIAEGGPDSEEAPALRPHEAKEVLDALLRAHPDLVGEVATRRGTP
jgi:hypothetical protein